MHETEMIVTIVAMCLTYSLLKHIFTPREVKIRKSGREPFADLRRARTRVVEEVEEAPDPAAENAQLKQRSEELLHRLSVLEEILGPERKAQRS